MCYTCRQTVRLLLQHSLSRSQELSEFQPRAISTVLKCPGYYRFQSISAMGNDKNSAKAVGNLKLRKHCAQRSLTFWRVNNSVIVKACSIWWAAAPSAMQRYRMQWCKARCNWTLKHWRLVLWVGSWFTEFCCMVQWKEVLMEQLTQTFWTISCS